MKHPFQQVIHIADRKGPKGGAYWYLTLECGHKAFRAKPSLPKDPAMALARLIARNFKIAYAPERVRCRLCVEEPVGA